MPKTKGQELIFTVMMVLVMVYGMIVYNICLETGGLQNGHFLTAFHELWFMGPIAFILDFFFYGRLSKWIAFRTIDPKASQPILIVLTISAVTVCLMCPTMSLAATLLIQRPELSNLVVTWMETTVKNFPMALCWQLFLAGPLVRKIFRLLFSRQDAKAAVTTQKEVEKGMI